MRYVCIWLIRLYQRLISPLKSRPTCRFTPTCSAYALEAFSKRGFFVGLYLTVTRILRCNPFCPGGYDPVPERGQRRRERSDKQDNEDTMAERPRTICEDYVTRRSRRQTSAIDCSKEQDNKQS